MTFIKICGITNVADAFAAVDAGADALGFNFYRPSPRYIDPGEAKRIIEQLPPTVLTVGVFVSEPEIENIAKFAGVQALQLHGDESPSQCESLNHWYLIKALSVKENFDPSIAVQYDVDAIMLDSGHQTLRGGTGQVFDWSIAQHVNALGMQMFLAGGLSPENVAEAIESVRPYAVDTCSGIELKPGVKDHNRLRDFVTRARSLAVK